MDGIQLSLYGKTWQERFHQITGWILLPYSRPLPAAKFQCLILENGQAPEWYAGRVLKSLGGCWTASISESPNGGEEFFLWRILQENAPRKYYLTPHILTKLLNMAMKADCRFPRRIEVMLVKQGGILPRYTPSCRAKCARQSNTKTHGRFSPQSAAQLDLPLRF